VIRKHAVRPSGGILLLVILAAQALLLSLGAVPALAGHDLGQQCYTCHNIKSGQVWTGSYSIWSSLPIGMPSYARPITCDVCHTDYGAKFTGAASNRSKHPVRIIAGTATAADNTFGTVYGTNPAYLDCRDCHYGNVTVLSPDLSPDVAPANYLNTAGNTATDGYPNHDNTISGYTIVPASWNAQNVVTPGTEPHLGLGYTKSPAADNTTAASYYALCFDCHDGTAGKTNRMADIKGKYLAGAGHYYKYGTPTGGSNGSRMPCSDCHLSHNSSSSRLYKSPKGTVITFANPAAPSAAEIRAICNDCHDDYNAGNTGNGTPLVRGVEPPPRKYGVAEHDAASGTSCTTSGCHDAHDAPAKCNSCHGVSGSGSGAPPDSPKSGARIWSSSVDRTGAKPGQGLHRVNAADNAMQTDHETFPCTECHTSTPGSGATHNDGGPNATMTNLVARKWTDNATVTTWNPRTDGSTSSVVDDSCNNVDCHSPYSPYQATRPSGTPFPYERYWENYNLWDCYTCHGYDAAIDGTNNPAAVKRAIDTGSHTVHVDTGDYALPCATCHVNNAGNLMHRDGLVQVPITGTLGAVTLAGTYSANNQAPTDNNAAKSHRPWGTCSNTYCHSTVQKNNPDGLPNDNLVYATPSWGSGSAAVVCGSCHKGAGTDHGGNGTWMDTGSHTVHAQTKQYRCTNCHQYPGQTPTGQYGMCEGCHSSIFGTGLANRHVDGYVNVRFGDTIPPDNVFLLSGVFDANGDHGNDNTIVPGMPYGTCENLYCHGTGTPALTGGANQAGAPNIPKWGTPNTALCGSCHGGPGGATNYPGKASNWPTSGAHALHVNDNVIGPNPSLACTDCHTANTVATHGDGKVDFRTAWDNATAATKAATRVCDPCHGSGVATAKANWATASSVDCLTCHGITPAYTYANATGRVAPNVAGDNATYGANAAGHNRPTGSGAYASGNPAANRTCGDCHDLASAHIDGTDNTTYSGNRLLDNVNGVTGITTVSGLCAACHTTSGSSPATKKSVNTHGNAGYAGRLEGSFTGLNCDQCHEPHGMVNVSTGSTGVNLWMINPTITVTTGVTVSPVRLFAKTGANSFNAYDPGSGNELNASLYNTNASDQLCVVCHASASNPGQPMTRNIAGRHNAPGYSGNEAGKDCSGCHSHNQDGNIATVDGLMPLACNACHSYPGVSGGTFTKSMSAVHAKHVGTPSGTSTSRQYDCTLCHFNYTHNQNGVTAGAAWPGTYYTLVDIRFDNTWNPGTPTYAGANAYSQAAPGNGGTGTCAGLYCHGGNASLNAGWGGSAASPKWDNTIAVTCGACHDTGTGDTTPGTRFATKNHPAHLDNAWGPGVSAFSAGGNCSEGTGCHPKYDLSPSTTHANNAKDLRSTAGDNGYVGATLATTQVCVNCHSTTASSQGTGDTLVRTQGNWDNASYKVPCVTCHNNGVQGWQNLNGTGDRAPNIDVSYYGNGHGASGIDNASTTTDSGLTDQVPPVRCETCHDETGAHIGTAKDGTNPWRLDGAATNYTQTGGLDHFCLTQCHSQTALPPRHARIVNGTWGVGKDNALHTHPTATESVGTSKDRWYQVNADASMPMGGTVASPLTGDLTTKSPAARTAGTLLACVTCHDPHGVGTAATPTRTFSGSNDNGYKMLRYKSAGGVMSPLCTKCHK
jgi:predicted CxxxxCH...CXXCH cytochrome family protein